MCKWQKIYNGYTTDCGHSIIVILRNAVYCPFCGDEIEKHRENYQAEYYEKNKARLRAKMAENYRKRKVAKE